MDKMNIYNKMPLLMQNLACYYEGSKIRKYRYGKEFWDLLHEYEERKQWSYEQLCSFRDARLRLMVKHCYETVPYYKRLFDKLGVDYRTIRTLDDLKLLPVLTKKIVKENICDFVSGAVPRNKLVVSHTSGTTGSGFRFYTTREAISEQWAVWWRYRRNLGIKFNTWCALFGGKSVVPITQTSPPFWRYNRPCAQVYFSNYHINEENLKWYVAELARKELKWIHGYPSAINLIAEYVVSNNIELPYKVKFVTTGAENLMPIQESNIRKAFGVIPYQHYGLAEGVANFSQDENREMYVDEDFAAVEFLQREDGSCEIIGTTLTNFAMPLLRYQTGDIASFEVTDKGRKILELNGRNEDYVVLPNGTKIGRLDHIFKDMVNVIEAQIIQEKKDEVVLRVVRNNHYSEKDERMLRKEASQRMRQVNIVIEYVDRIPRTSSGKLKFVVSKVQEERVYG